jgi:ABC-type Zn uptake system ZnuABC Zn-binding protein ZnuA
MFETMYQKREEMIPQLSEPGMPPGSDLETQFASPGWTTGWRIAGFLAALVTGILLLAACGVSVSAGGNDREISEQPSGSSGGKINVVATNSLLADLVDQVGGDLVEVTALVPPGVDAHAFQLKPSHNLAVGRADLLVSNGGGLDDFLNPVLRNSARPEARWIIVADGLEPSALLENGDPHFWLDPRLAIDYVKQIRDGLVEVDPKHESDYMANAETYAGQISALDQEIEELLSQVAEERRHLVTYHDAFGHLARRYNWEATALVPDDGRDVAPGALAGLVRRINRDGLPSVFVEPQFQQELLTRTAREAGIRVGVIYSLPGPGVATYLDMMRYNGESIARELR